MNNVNKGTFLTNFYGVKDIPALVDKEGNPTKFATAATFWDEPAPKTESDVKRLVALGETLSLSETATKKEETVKETPKEVQALSTYGSGYGGRQHLSFVGNNKIKVPFIKTGTWKHDSYGEVKFTENDIDQLINNFKKDAVGFTPYLTLGHLDEEPDSTDSHRKRGNLTDIVVEDNVGYGIFDVPDNIYQSIRQGEYEYSSGEFNRKFTSKDDGSDLGTAVIRVALTNSPFLPFGEHKIQALSEDAESCPENRESCVFLLSIDEPKNNESSEEITSEESKSSEVEQPQDDTDINNLSITETIMTNPNVNNVAEPQVAEDTIVKEPEAQELSVNKAEASADKTESATVVTANVATDAIARLSSQLAKVEELYKNQLDAANKTIAELGSKLENAIAKIDSQSEVTQAFSTSMSQAREQQLINQLQSSNIQPALVEKFLAFKSGLTGTGTVKLSVGAGEEAKEVEYGVADTVANLLIQAANQTPLVEQQLGVSAGRKTGAYDFANIIARNREAASK